MKNRRFLGIELYYDNNCMPKLREVSTTKFLLNLSPSDCIYDEINLEWITCVGDSNKIIKINVEESNDRVFFLLEYEDESKELLIAKKSSAGNKVYNIKSFLHYLSKNENLVNLFINKEITSINIWTEYNIIEFHTKDIGYLIKLFPDNSYNVCEFKGKILQAISYYYVLEKDNEKYVIQNTDKKVIFTANEEDELTIEPAVSNFYDGESRNLIIKKNNEVIKYLFFEEKFI